MSTYLSPMDRMTPPMMAGSTCSSRRSRCPAFRVGCRPRWISSTSSRLSPCRPGRQAGRQGQGTEG